MKSEMGPVGSAVRTWGAAVRHIGKDLPAADVADLYGKKWNLGDLKGKTLLVNVWAIWCGPCRSEHPHLQKLHDKVKDRKDIGVLMLSIDEAIGDVAPYMKEKNYSFPVLLASQYVGKLNPSAGVPQNWIVDANGKWTWMQVGFGDEEGWEKGDVGEVGKGEGWGEEVGRKKIQRLRVVAPGLAE
jgi:thiol-disulfide isomerase/thioredoxin